MARKEKKFTPRAVRRRLEKEPWLDAMSVAIECFTRIQDFFDSGRVSPDARRKTLELLESQLEHEEACGGDFVTYSRQEGDE